MSVTMKSIARQVGVTQPVVSAVLNNRSYCRVSAEKREAILALAKELGFRPNSAARHLRGKKTNTIAIFTNQASRAGVGQGQPPDHDDGSPP